MDKLANQIPASEINHLIRYVPAAVAVFDKHMNYIIASERWIIDYHLQGLDLVGKNHYDIMPDVPDYFREVNERCLRGATEFSEGDKVIRVDPPEELWISWIVRPWLTEAGDIGGIVILTEALNERRQLEAQLKQSEERYVLSTRGGEIGIWDWFDVAKPEQWWSEQVYQLLGYKESELPANISTLISLLHHYDRQRVMSALNTSIQKALPLDIQFRLQRKEGEYRWFRAKGTVEQNMEAGTTRLSGSIHSIHKRKLAEEKILDYSKVLEHAVEGISKLDTQGRYTYVNEAYAAMLDARPVDLIGKSWEISVYPDDLERVRAKGEIMRTEGKVRFDAEGVKKGGKRFYKNVTMVAHHDEQGRYDGFYCLAQDITEKKNAERAMETLALQDKVTGLPNRADFLEHMSNLLSDVKKRPRAFALMLLDLDKFKNVNNDLGHYRGDLLLKKIAKTFLGVVHGKHYLARLAGDEFVILLDDLKSINYAKSMAGNVIKALKHPFYIDKCEVHISACVGIAIYPSLGATVEELIQQADSAMYHAKSKGYNRVQFYSERIRQKKLRELLIERHLRHAIEKNEFYLVYQPQISLETRQMVGVEVLLRWKNKVVGQTEPMEFIPIAEKMGFINELGCWVVNEAFETISGWLGQKLVPPDFSVAINCAASQFKTNALYDVLEASLTKSKLKGVNVTLEITETSLMDEHYFIRRRLNGLVEKGFQIAIDDFGTGYSCLSYINQLPVTVIKIDKSFILNLEEKNNREIIRAIVGMAKGLGLTLVAEGVQNEAQCQFLSELECDYVQGAFFSMPLQADEVLDCIAKQVPVEVEEAVT